jgi:hypothetical protein
MGVGDPAAAVTPEAQHAAMCGGGRGLPPPRPHVLEGRHHPIAGPRPHSLDDRCCQLVHGQVAVAEGIVDRGDDQVGLVLVQAHVVGVRATPRDGAQRGCPLWQVRRGQQVHGATGAVGLDE